MDKIVQKADKSLCLENDRTPAWYIVQRNTTNVASVEIEYNYLGRKMIQDKYFNFTRNKRCIVIGHCNH